MKTKPLNITSRFLLEHRACKSQYALFNKVWPAGRAEVNPENIRKALMKHVDLYWAVYKIHGVNAYTHTYYIDSFTNYKNRFWFENSTFGERSIVEQATIINAWMNVFYPSLLRRLRWRLVWLFGVE